MDGRNCSGTFQNKSYTKADPGFSEGGSDKLPPTLSNCYQLLLNKSFFQKKKYGQDICIRLTLVGSTLSPEPPLDPPQIHIYI